MNVTHLDSLREYLVSLKIQPVFGHAVNDPLVRESAAKLDDWIAALSQLLASPDSAPEGKGRSSVFQHDEALLNDLLTELAARTEEPWIAPEASVRSSMIRDVVKTYAMQMLRRISE